MSNPTANCVHISGPSNSQIMSISSSTSKHKAVVTIERPVSAVTPQSVPVEAIDLLEEYGVIAPRATCPPIPESTTITSKPAQASVEAKTVEPPVVWTGGGCSQTPSFAPPIFNFDLPASTKSANHTTSIEILPFSPVKIEPAVTPKPEAAQMATDNSVETPKPDPEIEDTPTPNPASNTPGITIPIGTALGYSSTFSSAPTRSTGTSPPSQSYAISTSPTLSYSQASSGASFSEANSAEPLTKPYTGASYSSVLVSPTTYASQSHTAVSYASAF